MPTPTICVFEDEQAESFLPLTYTRPIFDLRCGILTLFEKISLRYPGCALRHVCRSYLARMTAFTSKLGSFLSSQDIAHDGRQVLFINGRLLPAGEAEPIPLDGEDALYLCNDTLVAARLSGVRLAVASKWLAEQDSQSVLASIGREVPVHHVAARLVLHPWDLISTNGEQIAVDFALLRKEGHEGTIHPAAAIYAPEAVYVGPGAEVQAMAVLDARSGPIFIDEGATVQPFSYIQGPSYIGPGTLVVSGRIRECTSLGPYCRVGGEIECSIFQAYSNKYHDGFVGHSYIGEWVNIGALTTTSDLKNTYGSIRVNVGGQQVDTGLMKLGSIIGDHVKLGIGVLLNAGSTIGTGCNLFGGGMLPKVVPCFVWGGDGQYQEYDFERMLRTAQIAMSRRQVEQTERYYELLRYVFDITAPLRRAGRI
jgi:UDP-N-acetylglucosamine diphosphorylase/glucosamine-1-phosphate N-acetyltransferase